ncbi:ParB N-terminal domain-containing protein [Neoaquamicrobium sediminum]|uniref:ParB N-terminal domain-containing protein n=1 Tax=Neoaquamicrobium sediminum TaxID=1849104 RepID=UPI00360F8F5E
MRLMKIDPRALVDNPDRSRQTPSTPQADKMLLASIKVLGIIVPPEVAPQTNGGNGFVINAGHRRTRLAIKAGLEEIDILVKDEADNDNGAMRSFAENIVREGLNPVDQWRAIERLIALGWTEDAVALALALQVRVVKQLRLFASLLPAMLDQIAKGDSPKDNQLRTIAAAPLDEQAEVWKKYKPSRAYPKVDWHWVATALTKTRMYAKDASFGDDLAQAYGIEWALDLWAPEGEDGRYTTNAEAYLGAQQEWMANHLPKRGIIVETNTWGGPVLPPKAERIHGKPSKSDHTAMYIDRDGKVQSVHYRMPEAKKAKSKSGAKHGTGETVVSRPRPEITGNGVKMIGDFRTDALHDALGRAPIEDDTLMALLVLAFASQNVRVDSGAGGEYGYGQRFGRLAAMLFNGEGDLAFDIDTLRVAARLTLIEVLSCRENATRSGIVARIAGEAIGADSFLPNMGTDDFLSCLSRPVIEAACKEASVSLCKTVRETRAALAKHFTTNSFVHPAALFAPDAEKLRDWLSSNTVVVKDQAADAVTDKPEAREDEPIVAPDAGQPADGEDEGFREAAE